MPQRKTKFLFKIYIAGMTPDHQQDVIRLKQTLSDNLENFSLEVVDLIDNPTLAEQDKILATPTIVRSLPKPVQKYIFNLSDTDNIIVGVNLITKTA